jgi:hypothetical protein
VPLAAVPPARTALAVAAEREQPLPVVVRLVDEDAAGVDLRLVRAAVIELAEGPEVPERAAATAASAVGDLQSEVSYVEARIEPASAEARFESAAVTAGWLESLQRTIRGRISRKLWSLIAAVMTPTGWSLSGKAGVGLIGLTGEVGIQIDFG